MYRVWLIEALAWKGGVNGLVKGTYRYWEQAKPVLYSTQWNILINISKKLDSLWGDMLWTKISLVDFGKLNYYEEEQRKKVDKNLHHAFVGEK